jgi:Leucine-rich repeat (LRR) protein
MVLSGCFAALAHTHFGPFHVMCMRSLLGNSISSIPATLFRALPCLTTLSFANNDRAQLLSLPQSVNSLGALRKFYLRGSSLSCLPSSYVACS